MTSEFHVKVHLKNRYRTYRFVTHAISVLHVNFEVEFTLQAVNFSTLYHILKNEGKEIYRLVIFQNSLNITRSFPSRDILAIWREHSAYLSHVHEETILLLTQI